jgi:hypothetical protein
MKRIALTFSLLLTLAAAAAPSALAEKPRFFKGPDIDIIDGTQHVDTPPAIPQVGQTLWGNNGSPDCNPACDPALDNRTDHDTLINPADGPSGQFYSWRRCNDNGCFEVQSRSTTVNTYVVKAEDAGSKLQLVVTLVNYDCAEERTTDHYRECRYAQTSETALSETVAQPIRVAITPDTLAEGVAGTPYSQTLAASGGTGPYAYALDSGTLPPGVTLSTAGALAGTPTTGGKYTFTVRATGSGAQPGTRTYTVVVRLGLPTSLPNGVTGVAYTQPLAATGATGAVAFSIGSGALPDGLAINGSQLVGTPTKQGSFTFTVHAADAGNASGDRQYTVQVVFPAVTIEPAELPEAIRDQAYRVVLTASGGTAPYTFKLDEGELPEGVTLAPNGLITGRPSEDGVTSFELTVSVTDRYGAPATHDYELEYYGPTIVLKPAKLKPLKLGTKFKLRLRATGGTKPYLFEVDRGKLPEGVRLGPKGVLQGKPAVTGTFRVTVLVTDGKGATQTFLLKLVVAPV